MTVSVSLEDKWELPGAGADSLNRAVDFLTETPAHTRSFAFILLLCFDKLGARRLGEDDRKHYGQRCSSSAFRAAHVTPFCRS